MKRLWITAILMLVLAACAQGPSEGDIQTAIAETEIVETAAAATATATYIESISVDYCTLIANPSQYDGQVVRVSADYSVGWEWAFLSDANCSPSSSNPDATTWVIIDDTNLCEDAVQVNTALPSEDILSGSIVQQVTITGIFHNSRSGHLGGYPFGMEFICLQEAGEWQADSKDLSPPPPLDGLGW